MGKPITSRRGGLGSGYFVMTKTVYNGNFGSTEDNLNPPNAKCLAELTTDTDWKGYSTANANGQLFAAKVHAFLAQRAFATR